MKKIGYLIGDDQTPAQPSAQPGEDKKFSQEEINSILKKEKVKWEQKQNELLKSLENIKQSASLSQKEKEELEKQISDIQDKSKTELELAKEKIAKMEKGYLSEKENYLKEVGIWKNRFSDAIIKAEITKAANDEGAFSSEQIYALLAGKTQLVEVKDEDGNSTGRFEVKSTYETANSKGEHITLSLSPSELLKKMKEDSDKYGNLFKSNVNNGAGSTPTTGKKKNKINYSSNNFADYKDLV